MPGAEHAALLEDALFQIKRVVVGPGPARRAGLLCLLANGHCLIEGVPGLAKTLTVSTLSQVVGGQFSRVQFTPDLVPADLVGTRIWRPSTEDFDIEWGPVFANIVLADEINRAPAKVQSALLEAMAERQVTVGGHTRRLPAPFLVLATQNPIESEGVYALPEAQRDRFLMHVVVPQPTYEEETAIALRMSTSTPQAAQVLTLDQLVELQDVVRNVFVHHAVQDYAVRLVMATREPARWGLEDLDRLVALGASPRGTLGLIASARALAVLRGRRFVVPQDVFDVAPEVLRHRVTLTYDALAEGMHADDVVRPVLGTSRLRASRPSRTRCTRQQSARLRPAARRRPPDDRRPSAPGSASVAEVASRASVLRRLELEVLRRLDGSASGDHLTVGARPGQRARRRPRVRAGRRRPAHRLEPHGPVGDHARAHHRGRARGRHLDRGRPFGEPRLRHGPRGEARRRPRRGGGLRHAHRPRPQPARRAGRRRHRRLQSPPPRSGRAWLMAALATMYDTPRQDGAPPEDARPRGRAAPSARRRSRAAARSS